MATKPHDNGDAKTHDDDRNERQPGRKEPSAATQRGCSIWPRPGGSGP